jgi:hypothetical protein
MNNICGEDGGTGNEGGECVTWGMGVEGEGGEDEGGGGRLRDSPAKPHAGPLEAYQGDPPVAV